MSETTTTATPALAQSGVATKVAHWPGQDVPCCEAHAQKMGALAVIMGFPLSFTECAQPMPCSNCLTEKARKR